MQYPYSDKKEVVRAMFDEIASSYDFLNHFLSLGIDKLWRRRAIKIIGETHQNAKILDVATGTGDLAIAAMKLSPVHITGIDISVKMLDKGREKIVKKGLTEQIDLIQGDSGKIPFADNIFDVTMVAFGVRNFSNPETGLKEMYRVLRKEGLIMVLEFTKPASFPLKQLYRIYFLHIVPFIGRVISKNRTAYSYLPGSVMEFPDNEQFMNIMKDAGFVSVRQVKLSGGIAGIYTGLK